MVRNKSFTLIELLVVIAIIGLLASIVLVSMGGIKSKAKITKALEFSQSIQHALGSEAVGIWGFDEGSGATALDGSGYSNNGTINGATYTNDTPQAAAGRGTGKYALSFDGVNDYVRVSDSNSLDITSVITLEAWVKGTSAPSGDKIEIIVGKFGTYALFYDHIWGGSTFLVYIPAGFNSVSTPGTTSNIWHHFAGVYDGYNVILYVDGKELARKSGGTGSIIANTYNLGVGAYGDGTEANFNGLIDEVRVYEKALTLGEIQKHYAEGLERHKDLVIK